jgi:hypothetical protein
VVCAVGLLVLALLLGRPRGFVLVGGLGLRLVVLVGILVEGRLVVAGGVRACRRGLGDAGKESLQRLAVIVAAVVGHVDRFGDDARLVEKGDGLATGSGDGAETSGCFVQRRLSTAANGRA